MDTLVPVMHMFLVSQLPQILSLPRDWIPTRRIFLKLVVLRGMYSQVTFRLIRKMKSPCIRFPANNRLCACISILVFLGIYTAFYALHLYSNSTCTSTSLSVQRLASNLRHRNIKISNGMLPITMPSRKTFRLIFWLPWKLRGNLSRFLRA